MHAPSTSGRSQVDAGRIPVIVATRRLDGRNGGGLRARDSYMILIGTKVAADLL
jgi:hypothetical protein